MNATDLTPSERIDALIAGIADWRGKTFADLRQTILAAQAGIVEEWKWMGSPVWSCDGMIAMANAHKGKVKLTFMHGAQLPDPDKLFNDGLDGNARRAIDLFEGDRLDKRALKNLVRAAIEYNRTHLKKNTRRAGEGTKARADKAA
ncbi:DUF1801 domain-containing protein [Burkholderia cepacia]|uniref:DUF1801 domain-containing protein n=1 Tax=Burkholderia cepacia TaxID=292 RepID=UPI000757D3C3|nr:DUF1801 domain-containing protein [Burkholderia cepacia]KWH52466.1 hypothetical protein WM00_19035 [Burkholderia cepacia]OUE39476.1 hypothetical protein BZY94_30210 [Burkholderia territorii]HDR9496948.1 DUF1801 domain-containing protein [Burkholderia cepacia]